MCILIRMYAKFHLCVCNSWQVWDIELGQFLSWKNLNTMSFNFIRVTINYSQHEVITLPYLFTNCTFNATKARDEVLFMFKQNIFTLIQILQDSRFCEVYKKISLVLHDDTQYEKCSLNMKTQRCFAVRSGMNGMSCG